MLNIKETITLFYKEGSSDKFYLISIEEKNGKYTLPFTYGRRGDTGQSGNKATKPLDYDKAKKMYDKIVAEKMAKGYSAGEGMKPYSGTVNEKKISGINAQLLNPITEDECEKLLYDHDWGAQEKFDGKRILINKKADKIIAINRRGLECGYPSEIEKQISEIIGDVTLDGEMIGTNYHVFDILYFLDKDLKNSKYLTRYNTLVEFLSNKVTIAPLAITTKEKLLLFKSLKNKEGIVFKKLDSFYIPGRPSSGGEQLKFKFYSTASCIVTKLNNKNSISLGLYNKDKLIDVGNATLYSNKKIPRPQDIVEIKYLYAIPGGSLYQPIYIGLRDDIEEKNCTISQLKYKNEE